MGDDLYSWFSGAGSRQTNRIQTEKPQQSRYNLFIFFCISKKLKTDIHIIKQDIRIYIYIYVAYSRPNGWTDWTEIFCEHSWVAGGGDYRLKKSIFFSHGHWPMPDPSASIFFFLFYRSHSPVQGMKQNLRKINIISYFKEILELNRKINN